MTRKQWYLIRHVWGTARYTEKQLAPWEQMLIFLERPEGRAIKLPPAPNTPLHAS